MCESSWKYYRKIIACSQRRITNEQTTEYFSLHRHAVLSKFYVVARSLRKPDLNLSMTVDHYQSVMRLEKFILRSL